jgi:hypothetical protein
MTRPMLFAASAPFLLGWRFFMITLAFLAGGVAAILSGAGNTTGNALVEVYALN